jgi:exodeoxyribonuclease V alpha subunit
MEIVIGSIKNYVFHNEQNSYSIARLITSDEKQITIVGYFPKMSEDVVYEFQGEWVNHSTYGQQFKVQSFKKAEAQSIGGLISYLSSPYFTGIGPKTAEKIVELLGEDAIQKIIDTPEVLKQVGLNAIRIAKLKQQLIENQTNEYILVTLYGYNISGKIAMKLLSKYKMATIEKIEQNPYQLIDDIDGIGFLKADEIAKKIGIHKDDMRRIKAAIIYALETIGFQNGDVYLTHEQLINYTKEVLRIEVDIKEGIDALVEENKIKIEDERFYLQVSYMTEIKVAQKILEINQKSDESFDESYIKTLIDMIEIQKNMSYTEVQKTAILSAMTHKFTVITGGPGTGKTTIIDGLLDVYRNYYKLNFDDHEIYQKIALLAPTGRAAKRMKELLDMQASTIHRHLGFSYDGMFAYDETHLLPQQLIIVDETSMIDLFLANKLFSAIRSDAKIIFVGDVDQLPSVGPGQVLSDIITSGQVETVVLDEIHRQAKDSSIVDLAFKVNMQVLNMQDLKSANDVYLYKTHPNQIKHHLISQIKGALEKGFDMVDDIQVLAPMYKGELGIDRLNEILQESFNPNKDKSIKYGDKTYYCGDKVIQLVNDPKRLIMNGDIGRIEDIFYNEQNEQLVKVRFDDNIVMYDKSDLDELNLAYAISIHKSQGSEYKIVMMPMIKHYMHMLKKELIYTAITRAKQYLIILGDMPLLVYASTHLANKRQTTLALRLGQEFDMIETDDADDDLSPYDFM